ncbi:alpha/beta hydrolase [Patescibacteria group bacterium]
MENVEIKSKDGYRLIGTYYQAGSQKAPCLLLLHQMRKDRSSWEEIAKHLRDSGIHVLTLDIRGHGESTQYGSVQRTWKDFCEIDFENIALDVEAAKNWMHLRREADSNSLGLIGASITANITIQMLALDPDWRFGVALSPGLNYHGLKIKPAISSITKPLLVLSADNDPYQGEADLVSLFTKTQHNITFHSFENSDAHGTDMFLNIPTAQNVFINYINEVLKT